MKRNRRAKIVATLGPSANDNGSISKLFEAGAEVSPQVLKENNKIKSRHDVLKILGNGNLTKSLTVTAHRFSKAAREKIEQAGGTVNEIAVKTTVAEQKRQAKEAAASK